VITEIDCILKQSLQSSNKEESRLASYEYIKRFTKICISSAATDVPADLKGEHIYLNAHPHVI
jgi:hypothetical protein